MFEILSISSVYMLAVMSPGPDFAVIVRNSLSNSKKHAIYTALGISCGVIFHVLYCVTGLAVIILKSKLLFSIIKIIGALYLLFLSFKSLCAKEINLGITEKNNDGKIQKSNTKYFKSFLDGLICNIFNPKATLFFLSMFTVLIKPETSFTKQFFYGAEFFIISFVWFTLLGMMIGHRLFREKIQKFQSVINKLIGFFLLILGFKILLMS